MFVFAAIRESITGYKLIGNVRKPEDAGALFSNKWGEEQWLLMPEQRNRQRSARTFTSQEGWKWGWDGREGGWNQSNAPVARISSTKLNQKRLMPTARFQHGGNIIRNYTFALQTTIVIIQGVFKRYMNKVLRQTPETKILRFNQFYVSPKINSFSKYKFSLVCFLQKRFSLQMSLWGNM